MKKRNPNNSLKQLRGILGKSQVQFATMLGVSLSNLVHVECGDTSVTQNLNRRIITATGASLLKMTWVYEKGPKYSPIPDGEIRNVYGYKKPYTTEVFNNHRKQFATSAKAAEEAFNDLAPMLRELLSEAGKGAHRGRLPALVVSFLQWRDEAELHFELKPSSKSSSKNQKA
jgi:transcriptional regulator with XRE-family HTH domain